MYERKAINKYSVREGISCLTLGGAAWIASGSFWVGLLVCVGLLALASEIG